eukprot:GHVH01017004.1.p2 GENE.GHVH01017004.1~~GHVH01017004.1.p2  ORF type:complete len:354 (+),score=42.23 GHVH01017004.1:1442-2503(+)
MHPFYIRVPLKTIVTNSIDDFILELLQTIATKPKFQFTDHQWCELGRISSVMSLVPSLKKDSCLATTREVYYLMCSMMSSQSESNRAINATTHVLRVPRRSLNIITRPKGLFRGDFTVKYIGKEVDTIINGLCPVQTRGIKFQGHVDQYADWDVAAIEQVLIVEKESIMYKLLDMKLLDRFPQMLILTASGMPDKSTLEFLSAVMFEIKEQRGNLIPTWVMTDSDPEGVLIALQYLHLPYPDVSNAAPFQFDGDISPIWHLRPLVLNETTSQPSLRRTFTSKQDVKLINLSDRIHRLEQTPDVVHMSTWKQWFHNLLDRHSYLSLDLIDDIMPQLEVKLDLTQIIEEDSHKMG